MNRRRILKTGQPYSFSQYFDLPFTLEDILAEFDCTFVRSHIDLPRQPFTAAIEPLLHQLQRNRKRIELINETARREALIAPILFEVVDLTNHRIYIEYSIAVSEHLRGTLDYYIANHNVIVIEAKQSDLVRGFTQLAVELVALDQWLQSDQRILYGIVTTGEDWRFGTFNRQERSIQQDPKRYLVPEELTELLEILVGIMN
ncbi:MAG: hypothetical protein F6K50_19590 [Moorea sp. SIO3I7]|uniref:hypothetical protein n=1 Tax=unclassified Moorena TaxID=2683338 RepID=UPI0013C1011B|nr:MULTISPECIES: hypothetical protein [unclassified Moorena]NEN97647.1 hypothetical protein [Moorena sp. SIO3I7]NEO05922.1 hypothetical protein [Moorena sp. SIO3I8]NEO12597.1 hypothetical protein [Moorena sp. SIO3E8]NEO18471.1 hypothetical protein [Moorena sp. SIO4A5]NEP26742.1 hypothetical protein [Moorena sp. SIO3I6]